MNAGLGVAPFNNLFNDSIHSFKVIYMAYQTQPLHSGIIHAYHDMIFMSHNRG